MMRWLKDKKREKRTSQSDYQKEDDYGFGKDKAASKSWSSRRVLPPTPAAPEEMSPHIYEEIPDLSFKYMSDNERALLQGKFGRIKSGLAIAAGAVHESASVTLTHCSFEKDEISPYLIVPVDNEVRQTPTDFHRNGTPEVHCDVIVKDTHCEILLTRKPKVGAFRLDNPALSVARENDGDRRNIRNNTHFCSRDRRASSYVQSAGNISSAFSATSSVFSSTSATKTHSGGVLSTLGNLIESQEPCQEGDFDKAEEKGVVTYSSASNFIPRATKLVFNPLPGKNPRKEAFGSDSSDELHGAGYSSIKENNFEAGCASLATSRENQSGSRCVTYATVECRDNLEPGSDGHVTYSSVHDQHFTNLQTKPNYSSEDHHNSQFNVKQQKSIPDSPNDIGSFGGSPTTGIIRSLSPSNSSNCIYALVTFPSEPNHYNTISDIAPAEFQENEFCQEGSFKSMAYSSINGHFGIDTSFQPCNDDKCDTRKLEAFPGKTSFHFNDTPGEFSHSSCYNFSERIQNLVSENRFRFDSNREKSKEIVNQTDLKVGNLTSSNVQPGNCTRRKSELHTSSREESNILLGFCFCSDENSSSCGCADSKHPQDDDLASVAGAAASDGPNSCRSCGRLIRQITYSESYSDETYDHVYSSRLLIRTGRRFSSPDITFSEVSNSEFHDIQNTRSVDFPYAVSRDDSWGSTRNSDILPPSYSASAESKLFYTADHIPPLKERIRVGEFDCNYNDTESNEHFQRPVVNSENREQQISSATSEHVNLNCSVSRTSAMASVKQSNNILKNESLGLKTENISILNNNLVQSSVSSNTDRSKSILEQTAGKNVVDNSVYKKSTVERPVSDDRFVPYISVVDKSVADKSVVDRSVADKSKKQDKSIADKSVADKSIVDRSVADKSKKQNKYVAKRLDDKSFADKSMTLDDKSFGDKVVQLDDKSVVGESIKLGDTSVVDESMKLSDTSVVDKSLKLNSALTLEPKNSGFTGLLTKFSRTKSKKSAKPQSAEIPNRLEDALRCDKDLEEIPEKNTKKLSYFFQRLAIKECTNDNPDCVTPQEMEGPLPSGKMAKDVKLAANSLKLLSLENNATSKNYQKYCQNEKQSTSLQTMKVTDGDAKSSAEMLQEITKSATNVSPRNIQSFTTGHSIGAHSDQVLPTASTSTMSQNVTVTSEGILSHPKPQFKTDSGDTCYEYDISTSSEGEQPGCEYFLSNGKNSLSLDREVQHLAESTFARRKCLCKRCKNEGLYTIADDEGDISDRGGLCPHLAAKFGDMRTIFEDLVVDQRAAILDCLSDNTFSPYGSRGHGQDGYCHECGCEILTSDSESLTTVGSLLSHQFRVTSPNGQPMSCDSDEGTMADNSCESADENAESKNNGSSSKGHYDGHSSGYDEPKGKSDSAGQKSRKKERKDKKTVSTVTHFTTKESERLSLTLSNTIHDDSPTEAFNVHKLKGGNKTITQSVSSESQRKSMFKKNTPTPLSAHSSRHAAGSPGAESKDDHSKNSDISRTRTSSITDKVLQDIYAPLPSKALSLLTSRGHSSPVGLTCTCGKVPQTSLATVAAHLATGKTIPPPSGCTNKDNSLTPSVSSLPHCDGDKKVGVSPVQKHSEKYGNASSEVEQFILSERKDNSKNDEHKMDVHSEKEVLVNNNCSPTPQSAMSNECFAPHTLPGNQAFRNEHSPVPVKEWSPLRSRAHTRKHIYEPESKTDCGVLASSPLEKRCTQMSLPHTTRDSAVSTLNAEITVAVSPEHSFNKTQYNDSTERSFVKVKAENSKTECTRKNRLKIVALDLLPESAVDGDCSETAHSLKKHAIHPKRSQVIEKMAKLFESNSEDNQKITRIKDNTILDSATKKDNGHRARPHQEYNCEFLSNNVASQPHNENNLISESVFNSPRTRSKKTAPASDLHNLARQDNLCGPPENHNLNINANPPAIDQPATFKTLRSRSRSRQGKENETKARSDNEGGRLKSGKIKAGKARSPYQTDSRMVKQRSPTQSSSSSVSSSSSSKRKSCHKKHKVSKKSYHRKRSKLRSERSKNGHGKEERTYYYFSSDFSDIDVVEVVNCETGTPNDASINNKLTLINKKRCASSDDLLMSSQDVTDTPVPATPNMNEGADGVFGGQEAYAIPVSSTDVRGRKNSNEPGASTQPSPEMTKYRKVRSDVYKSRKSNNKLLSDLIIRNYDMQIYGNI